MNKKFAKNDFLFFISRMTKMATSMIEQLTADFSKHVVEKIIENFIPAISKEFNIPKEKLIELINKQGSIKATPKSTPKATPKSSTVVSDARKTLDEKIKTAVDQDKFYNVSTGRPIMDSPANRKKFKFYDDFSIAGTATDEKVTSALKLLGQQPVHEQTAKAKARGIKEPEPESEPEEDPEPDEVPEEEYEDPEDEDEVSEPEEPPKKTVTKAPAKTVENLKTVTKAPAKTVENLKTVTKAPAKTVEKPIESPKPVAKAPAKTVEKPIESPTTVTKAPVKTVEKTVTKPPAKTVEKTVTKTPVKTVEKNSNGSNESTADDEDNVDDVVSLNNLIETKSSSPPAAAPKKVQPAKKESIDTGVIDPDDDQGTTLQSKDLTKGKPLMSLIIKKLNNGGMLNLDLSSKEMALRVM